MSLTIETLKSKITTSLFGRRFGLQQTSSAQTGATRGNVDLLVGPAALRKQVLSTELTTALNVPAYGVNVLPGTSVGSSAVYYIDPPVPGVEAIISGGIVNGPTWLKTANGENIYTTMGTSFTTVTISSVGGTFKLVGYSTAAWLAIGLTSGTSSNASGFVMSTTT